MATKKAGGISKDKNKNLFVRSLGMVERDGRFTQPKFYLGDKQEEAERRNQRMEQLWRCIVDAWTEMEPFLRLHYPVSPAGPRFARPLWTAETLAAARALARGESSVVLPPKDGMGATEYAVYINLMNKHYPVVLFRPQDDAALAQELRAQALDLQRHSRWTQAVAAALPGMDHPPEDPGQRLHHALDAYVADLEKEASLSMWKRTKANQAIRLRERHEDLPLAALDILKVDEMFRFWRNRPPVKLRKKQGFGQPMAVETCKKQLSQLRDFFKWLHRHPGYAWRRPEGYEELKSTPDSLPSDRAAKRRTLCIEAYSVEELAILYASASRLMRLFILLGLNCGFIAAETGTLVSDEIQFGQQHPENGRYGIVSAPTDSWIKRTRVKTDVYGEFRLWPHTVEGLRWAMRRRQRIESECPAIIVTEKGTSYSEKTKGGNKNSRVRNLWVSFIEKVRRERPDFRYLPFKNLRKTGGSLVRQLADGETQGIYLCHGKPVKSDALADIYSSRPFCRVFNALDLIEKHLAPMWEACPDPFGNGRKLPA